MSMSNQQELNKLAREHHIKIELFNGWKVTANDGNVYLVKKYDEMTGLVNNLVNIAVDNATGTDG